MLYVRARVSLLFSSAPTIDPRILVESTEPVTLDNIIRYDEAVSGDCIVEVPAVSLVLSRGKTANLGRFASSWGGGPL